jgi:DNA primase|tara:strand:- start:2278 stop:3207 length:930 start_codon:yes stop_codon:yes gene_type:complete
MVNQLLVTLVNSVLGSGKPTARNNYAYHCPFCHHHKPKLEVNLTENREGKNPWHCWACDARGTTVYQLFKKTNASSDKIAEANSLISSSKPKEYKKSNTTIRLPDEFISLSNGELNDITAKHAKAYLNKRNISKYDILKYNIGYCNKGLYANMIIIPTYDEDGRLNYFTARSFEKEPYIKYRNPSVSRNIIPNEHLINWNLPIILCEGLFDAISIKRNAIPLLGKNIQSNLMKKIVTSVVNKIYIALDKDAMKQALRFCENLMAEGKEVYLVDMQDKDPSEMGFTNFTKLIQKTVPLTYSSLMGYKLAV